MLKIILASLALFAGITSASAADLRGSTKDTFGSTTSDVVVASTNKSGLYINGSLGFSSGDRSIDGTASGEKIYLDNEFDDNGDPILVEDLTDNRNVDHIFKFGGDDKISGMVFGGGVSYLWQPAGTRFGIELDADTSFYTDNETSLKYGGFATDHPGQGNESTSSDPLSGSLKFQRDFDIDLVAKAHIFVRDDLSFYAGAGVSFANATLKGSHSTHDNSPADNQISDTIYKNSYDETDASVGLVLAAGAKWWINERVTLGLDYNYKRHDFDFETKSVADDKDCLEDLRRYSADKIGVEDDLHTVKVKLGYRLN